MHIKKTITPKVLEAHKRNAQSSCGPTSPLGKENASGNAVKHGMLSQKLRFKTEREKAAHRKLIQDLQRTVDWEDPVARVYAEEFAAAAVRRARFLALDQVLYRRQNPATELALETLHNSEVVDAGIPSVASKFGWECKELTVKGKKAKDMLQKNGAVAVDNGDDVQFEMHAKFTDPVEKLLRYDRATGRNLYRAGAKIQEIRRKTSTSKLKKHSKHHFDQSS